MAELARIVPSWLRQRCSSSRVRSSNDSVSVTARQQAAAKVPVQSFMPASASPGTASPVYRNPSVGGYGRYSIGSRVSEIELMHQRSSVGVSYPSPVKMWPRWLPQAAQRASVRIIPCDRSSISVTASSAVGW